LCHQYRSPTFRRRWSKSSLRPALAQWAAYDGAAADAVHKASHRRSAIRSSTAFHIVVARLFDIEISSAWIAPNDAAPADERTWIGRVQIFHPGEKGEHARRMIGVAGSVAEWLWQGVWIEDFSPDAMSESDWHLAGCPVDQPDDALMDGAAEVGELFARGGGSLSPKPVG